MLGKLFITKKDQKARNKNKIGLPQALSFNAPS